MLPAQTPPAAATRTTAATRTAMVKTMPFVVVTLNTFTAVPAPIRFSGQRTRLKKMARLMSRLNGGDVDAFVLCECIVPSVVEDLLQPLAELGWPYCTKPLFSDRMLAQNLMPTLMSGGVFIMSRWPIVDEHQRVFENAIGADALVSKGVTHARILKHGKMFNVMGTHMQAWKTTEARTVRLKQSIEIRDFIRRLDLSPREPLLFAGDINIDRDSQFVDLQNFLHVTELNMPPIVGAERHTVSKNNQLYGVDDPSQYRNDSWPDGCYDVYLDTLRCVCCADAWIDYVLTSRSHQLPCARSSSLQALPMHVPAYRVQLALNTWRKVRDLTDHYAVIGKFVFCIDDDDDDDDDSQQTTLQRRSGSGRGNRHSRRLVSRIDDSGSSGSVSSSSYSSSSVNDGVDDDDDDGDGDGERARNSRLLLRRRLDQHTERLATVRRRRRRRQRTGHALPASASASASVFDVEHHSLTSAGSPGMVAIVCVTISLMLVILFRIVLTHRRSRRR
jgi:hypothetical protein